MMQASPGDECNFFCHRFTQINTDFYFVCFVDQLHGRLLEQPGLRQDVKNFIEDFVVLYFGEFKQFQEFFR